MSVRADGHRIGSRLRTPWRSPKSVPPNGQRPGRCSITGLWEVFVIPVGKPRRAQRATLLRWLRGLLEITKAIAAAILHDRCWRVLVPPG